jgi:predicted glycosyltransferase
MIGAGGTMNRESAILETPVISCYPGVPLSVDQFYIDQGLMFRSNETEEIINKALSLLVYPNNHIKLKTDDLFNMIIENVYDMVKK